MAHFYSAGPEQDCWHDENSRFQFPRDQKTYGSDWELVASELANHFHSNHDGWDADWPLQIRIYEGETEVARFGVERDFEPVFYTRPMPNPSTQGTENAGE